MTNKKLWIAICLVAGVAAFFVLRSSQDDSGSESSGPRRGDVATRRIPERATGPRVEKSTSDERRRRHSEAKAKGESGDNDTVVEYVRNDGSEVRDHRKNPPLPQLESAARAPAKGVAQVAPIVLMKLRKTLRPEVGQCAEKHAAGVEDARAQVVVTASIAEEQMNIDKMVITTEGLDDDAERAFISCVEQQVGDRELVMDGAEDVSAHTMTFPFDF